MARRHAHCGRGQRGIETHRQHGVCAALADAHRCALHQAELIPQCGRDTRHRRGRIGGVLQRVGAAHERVGRVDGHVGNALQARCGNAERCHCSAGVAQPIGEARDITQRFGAHIFRSLEIEALQVQHVAQHAQHFPGRPRFAQRLHDAMETLNAPFGVDEGARGLGERRDGQQHVGAIQRSGLERGQRDHHVGQLQGRECSGGIGGIERRFDVQQQARFERTAQHLSRVEPAVAWHGTHELRAHGVGGFGQIADAGTGVYADPVRQREQLACLRMLRSSVAQQHGLAFAAQQRRRDGLCLRGRFDDQRRSHAGLHADGRSHFGQGAHPATRGGGEGAGHRHQPVVMNGVEAVHLAALLRRLTKALREQRVVLAQERAHHQHALQAGQRGDGRAEPVSRRRARDHAAGFAEISVPGTVVDVFAADAAHQLGQQIQFLNRAVRRAQGTDAVCAVVRLDLAQAARHVVERGGPGDRLPFTALLDHRGGQALVAVDGFVREAITIRDPAFIHVFVLKRENAHHLVVLDLDDQVGTGAVVRADRLAARQLPGACAVAKRLAGECTDRADVDHVARQLGVDRVADDGGDLGMLAAVDHAQLHHAGHLLAEAHAAGAVDAAVHLAHRNQRPHVFVKHDALLFGVTRGGGTVAHRQVLQLAFAALVANRAVQRVVDEQKFHHALLGFQRLVALGANDHALSDRRGTSRHRLGCLLDIDQAHATVGRDAQLLVVAEMRDVGASLVGGMHHHAALGHLHSVTVELDFNHETRRNATREAPFPLRGKGWGWGQPHRTELQAYAATMHALCST